MNILVKKFLSSSGSFEYLVKWAWSRWIKMEKLRIVKLFVYLSVTLVTMMAIFIVCTTQKQKGQQKQRMLFGLNECVAINKISQKCCLHDNVQESRNET